MLYFIYNDLDNHILRLENFACLVSTSLIKLKKISGNGVLFLLYHMTNCNGRPIEFKGNNKLSWITCSVLKLCSSHEKVSSSVPENN